MKKTKLYILALSVCLIFALTGCGNSTKTEITETAEAFLTAAQNADYATVSTYCSDEVLSSMGLDSLNISHAENHYYEHLDIDKSTLSEETRKTVSEYYNFFADNLIQDYSITETTYTDGTGTVNATITTYSKEATDYMASDAFSTELTELMTTYQNEHLNELSSIYMKNGEEAMQQAFYDAVIPLIMDSYQTNYNRFGVEELDIVLVLKKENDLWKIIDGYLPEE